MTGDSRRQKIKTIDPKATHCNCPGQSLESTTNRIQGHVSTSPQTTQQAFKAMTNIHVSSETLSTPQNYSVKTSVEGLAKKTNGDLGVSQGDSQHKLLLRTEAAAAAAVQAKASTAMDDASRDGDQRQVLLKQSGRNGMSNFHKLRSFFAAHKTVH